MKVKPINNNEIMEHFDEFAFMEQYLPNYYQNDDIAAIDDCDRVLDGEMDNMTYSQLKDSSLFWLKDYSMEEVSATRDELMRKCLESAFTAYLNEYYPQNQ